MIEINRWRNKNNKVVNKNGGNGENRERTCAPCVAKEHVRLSSALVVTRRAKEPIWTLTLQFFPAIRGFIFLPFFTRLFIFTAVINSYYYFKLEFKMGKKTLLNSKTFRVNYFPTLWDHLGFSVKYFFFLNSQISSLL